MPHSDSVEVQVSVSSTKLDIGRNGTFTLFHSTQFGRTSPITFWALPPLVALAVNELLTADSEDAKRTAALTLKATLALWTLRQRSLSVRREEFEQALDTLSKGDSSLLPRDFRNLVEAKITRLRNLSAGQQEHELIPSICAELETLLVRFDWL